MLRILLNIATVLSLLLFAATTVLWLRSYSRWDGFDWHCGHYALEIHSASGVLAFQRAESATWPIFGEWDFWTQRKLSRIDTKQAPTVVPDFIGLITDEMDFWGRYSWDPKPVFARGGFAYYRSEGIRFGNWYSVPSSPGCWAVETPYWFWFVISAVLPFQRVTRRVLRQRRGRFGLCALCGYDLRATPGRCPESGLVPEKTI